jgi:hypothetical protein
MVVVMRLCPVDTRSPREKLVGLLDQLQAKRSDLLAEIDSAAEREHQARVDALTANPGRLSTDKGAASPVYKIQQATGAAEWKLIDVEREILAATAIIASIDARADAAARADEVRREAERQAREAEVMAERKARGETSPAPAPDGAVIAIRRDDPRWLTARTQRGAA